MIKFILLATLFYLPSAFSGTRIIVTNNSDLSLNIDSITQNGTLKQGVEWAQLTKNIAPGKRNSILKFNRDRGVKKGKFYYFKSTLSSGEIPELKIVVVTAMLGKTIHSKMWHSLYLIVNGKKVESCKLGWVQNHKKYVCNYKTIDSSNFTHELNITISALQTLGSDNIEVSLHRPRAVIDAKEKNKINILAMNTYMRPASIFRNGQWKRAKLLPYLVSNYDVLVLSEVFDNSIRLLLKIYLRKFYPYFSKPLGKDGIISQDGGVIIFSKWPLGKQNRPKHQRLFKKNCAGSDCWSDKGVLYTTLNKSGMTYHIFGTHTQAYQSDKSDIVPRRNQFHIISNFIKESNIPKRQPVIIAGDLNIDAIGNKSEYNYMLELLNAIHPPMIGQVYSYDPNSNYFVKNQGQIKGEMLDYILVEKSHLKAIKSLNHIIKLKAFYPWKNGIKDLSDHYPVQGYFNFPLL